MNQTAPLVINRHNAWVRVGCSELQLLISQQYVKTVETRAELELVDNPQTAVGWLPWGNQSRGNQGQGNQTQANQKIPVYCLSPRLQLLADIPSNYAYIVVLKASKGLLGLACDAIQTHSAGSQQIAQDLPGCMLLPGAPFKTYAVIRDQLYLIVEPDTLESLIDSTGQAILQRKSS